MTHSLFYIKLASSSQKFKKNYLESSTLDQTLALLERELEITASEQNIKLFFNAMAEITTKTQQSQPKNKEQPRIIVQYRKKNRTTSSKKGGNAFTKKKKTGSKTNYLKTTSKNLPIVPELAKDQPHIRTNRNVPNGANRDKPNKSTNPQTQVINRDPQHGTQSAPTSFLKISLG